MKKFQFPLDTVLNYKNQVLDNLQNEHAQIIKNLMEAEKKLAALEEETNVWIHEFEVKRQEGITVQEIGTYEKYLYNLHLKIKMQKEVIAQLEERKEKKRQEVVEAKTNTASIEKLKEKKQTQYVHQVQKEEEQFIEEFVSYGRAVAKQALSFS